MFFVAVDQEFVKVLFALEQDDDGWPPVTVEGLWAIRLSETVVRLDNTPWFVPEVASGDLVAVEQDEQGQWWAGEHLRWSGHCTIRLIVFGEGPIAGSLQEALNQFTPFGVTGEGAEQYGMVALNVPPGADLAAVKGLLKDGEASGWWEYEEGCIGDAWLKAG